jgi:hypothetical protein
MSEPIIYVDSSEIRDGKLQELEAAIDELAGWIQANEPQLIAYNAYLTPDRTRLSVVHIHANNASLAFHMKVAGPAFQKFVPLVNLLSIDIYGQPSDDLVEQLRQKARTLGNGTVRVHAHHAGFAQFGIR